MLMAQAWTVSWSSLWWPSWVKAPDQWVPHGPEVWVSGARPPPGVLVLVV